MRRIYVGPFSRFAYEQKGMDAFVVFDAEADVLAQPVAEFGTADEARAYIDQRVADDPTMRMDYDDAE